MAPLEDDEDDPLEPGPGGPSVDEPAQPNRNNKATEVADVRMRPRKKSRDGGQWNEDDFFFLGERPPIFLLPPAPNFPDAPAGV